jgi:hypothetical protein
VEFGRRIPIFRGFSLEFSRDGRALSHGLEEAHVLPAVENWLLGNKRHPDYELVREWLEQKNVQIDEDQKLQSLREERLTVEGRLNQFLPETKYSPEFRKAAREAILKREGIPEEDD